MEIVVIGTEPPCVRCLTTFKRAQEVARQLPLEIEVKKIAIHSEEAGQIRAGGERPRNLGSGQLGAGCRQYEASDG